MANDWYDHKRLRHDALTKLGHKCNEDGCTWTHPDVLEVDHIVACMVTKNRESAAQAYIRILTLEHPEEEYQLLCANHHRLKTVRDREEIKFAF